MIYSMKLNDFGGYKNLTIVEHYVNDGDYVEENQLIFKLNYFPITSKRAGIISRLPEVGTDLQQGQTVYCINDGPIKLSLLIEEVSKLIATI